MAAEEDIGILPSPCTWLDSWDRDASFNGEVTMVDALGKRAIVLNPLGT